MVYYLSILSFLFVFTALDSKTNSKSYNFRHAIFLYITILLLLLLRTFVKIDLLPDLGYYKDLFDECANNDIHDVLLLGLSGRELGYVLLSTICRWVSSSFYFELFVIGLIVLFSYLRTIERYSESFWFSILIFFITIYPSSTYILRQYLAMSLLFLSINSIVERKTFTFFVIMLISFSKRLINEAKTRFS